MNTPALNESFANALRAQLVRHVSSAAAPRRRRRLLIGAGLGVSLALIGGGVAIAGGILVAPGGTEVTELAASASAASAASGIFQGSDSLRLGEPPENANAVEVSFVCLTAGDFTIPTAPYDPSRPPNQNFFYGASCSKPSDDSPITGLVALEALDGNRLPVSTTPTARWSVTARYVHATVTDWGVNEAGQSYGVQNENGVPELVSVLATNGKQGYAFIEELNGPMPRNPEEAATWNETHNVDRIVPVYESDGATQIGEFIVDAGPVSVSMDPPVE